MKLRTGTLAGLISPTVSIDTFTPKVKKDGIVVVFEVKNSYDAAYDLSSFIEKLPYGIIDTEARDIPTLDGLYQVFVEFDRAPTFPENLMNVLSDVQKLGETQEFNGVFYNSENEQIVDLTTLTDNVRLIPEEQINEFLEFSNSTRHIKNSQIVLESNTHKHSVLYESVRQINEDEFLALYKDYWEQLSSDNTLFGPLYEVFRTSKGTMVGKDDTWYLFK